MNPSLLTLPLLLLSPLTAQTPEKTPAAVAAAAPDTRPRVTLRWTTASESENYGFFVLRGDKEDGPFKPLHEKAIPGAGTSENPHDYVYEDFDVKQGTTYHYYLESVSTRGDREKFSPVINRTCCKPPKSVKAPDDKPDKPQDKPDDKGKDKPKNG